MALSYTHEHLQEEAWEHVIMQLQVLILFRPLHECCHLLQLPDNFLWDLQESISATEQWRKAHVKTMCSIAAATPGHQWSSQPEPPAVFAHTDIFTQRCRWVSAQLPRYVLAIFVINFFWGWPL